MDELQSIPVDKIRPNPRQPRTSFEEGSLEELAASIKEHGLVQPIIVRKAGKEYELIAGERRWRASRLAGIKEIRAVVKDIDARETLLESFLENANRDDLTTIERENAITELWESGDYRTQEELGKKLGKKGSEATGFVKRYVTAKALRGVFRVPESLSTQHLYEISALDQREDQKLAIDKALSENISVHEMRALIQTLKAAPAPIKKAILKNRVDLEDVKRLVERGVDDIGDKQASALVEDLEMLKEHKQMMRKEADSIVDDTIKEAVRSAKTGKERQIIIDRQKEDLERDERIFENSVTPVFELVHGWHIDYDRLRSQRWKDAFVKRAEAVDRMINEFLDRKK